MRSLSWLFKRRWNGGIVHGATALEGLYRACMHQQALLGSLHTKAGHLVFAQVISGMHTRCLFVMLQHVISAAGMKSPLILELFQLRRCCCRQHMLTAKSTALLPFAAFQDGITFFVEGMSDLHLDPVLIGEIIPQIPIVGVCKLHGAGSNIVRWCLMRKFDPAGTQLQCADNCILGGCDYEPQLLDNSLWHVRPQWKAQPQCPLQPRRQQVQHS